MHGKPGRTERGRPKERKRGRSTAEATVRRRQEERERKKQRLSSQNPKLKRPKGSENSGGQKAEGKHQSGVERTAQRSFLTKWLLFIKKMRYFMKEFGIKENIIVKIVVNG